MITRVVIEHYKSIESLDLELGPLTVIVGANASGKSNFVDALRFIREAVRYGLDHAVSERHGIDSIRQWSPSRPYDVRLAVHVEARLGYGSLALTLASTGGQVRVKREEGSWALKADKRPRKASYSRDGDGKISLKSSQAGRREFVMAEVDELFAGKSLGLDLVGLRRALIDFEAYAIFPNVLRTPQKPSSDSRLSASGDNLTSTFKSLTKTHRYRARRDEILSALRLVMPSLESILIQSLGGLMVPTFRVSEPNGKRHDFNVSQISDGTLRMLGLLTALYQGDRPAVMALEEPEQTVNPGVLAVLAEACREVSRSSQLIITTHSPHLVEHFQPDEIRTADFEGGVTKLRPISPAQKQAVMDNLFTMGELMTMEGLHG